MGEYSSNINGPAPLTRYPLAFSRLAAKINELCHWFSGIKAGPGITIIKSRGATIIAAAHVAKVGASSISATELHFADAAISIDIDENGVKLTNVATGAYAKFFPTGQIGYVNGTKSVAIDDAGVTAEDSSTGRYVVLTENKVHVVGPGSGETLKETLIDGDGVVISNGTNTCTINHSAITHNVYLREIDFCQSGIQKKILVLASAAYEP